MTFLVQQTLIYAVPLMIVALAGVFAERSGIINLALEGIMIFGAFIGVLFVRLMQGSAAVLAAQQTGNWVAMQGLELLAMLVAAAMGAVLINPALYDVLVTPNLNGDYLSDALAAQVGGLGLAPGGNFGCQVAIFEATHGTAPDIAGKDLVNPGSMLLSGAMLFDHLGWTEVAALIRRALATVVKKGVVTGDLAKEVAGAQVVGTAEFAAALIQFINSDASAVS